MIPTVTIPDGGPIATRPRNNPLYDRTWAGNARDGGALRFFYYPIGSLDGDRQGQLKTAADTNMIASRGCLPRHYYMHAYGLYACPCLRDVSEEQYPDLRRAVSAIRWSAVANLRFGDCIHTEIPAACILANVAGREPEAEYVPLTENKRVVEVKARGREWTEPWDLEPRPDYDPQELIEERNQFGIALAVSEDRGDGPKMSRRYPIEIGAFEDWHVRLEGAILLGGFAPHLRAFVNGVLLKGIQG